jgi:hypothetical protein
MTSPVSSRPIGPDRLESALYWYRIAAYITGILLILLTVEIIAKYGYGAELEMNGPEGFLAFVPDGTTQAINLSSLILIVHGWFYVVYLFTCFPRLVNSAVAVLEIPLARLGRLDSFPVFPDRAARDQGGSWCPGRNSGHQ